MSTIAVIATDDTFDDVVLQSPLPVLLDFWAPWCAPCISLGRVLEQIMPEYTERIQLVKVNADENPLLCKKHALRTLPRLSLYREGEEVAVVDERARARIERFLEDNI